MAEVVGIRLPDEGGSLLIGPCSFLRFLLGPPGEAEEPPWEGDEEMLRFLFTRVGPFPSFSFDGILIPDGFGRSGWLFKKLSSEEHPVTRCVSFGADF